MGWSRLVESKYSRAHLSLISQARLHTHGGKSLVICLYNVSFAQWAVCGYAQTRSNRVWWACVPWRAMKHTLTALTSDVASIYVIQQVSKPINTPINYLHVRSESCIYRHLTRLFPRRVLSLACETNLSLASPLSHSTCSCRSREFTNVGPAWNRFSNHARNHRSESSHMYD